MRRQPYYISVERYWNSAEIHRSAHGEIPHWVFDFISIHRRDNKFSLLGPSFIPCGREGSRRPRFEAKQFNTLDDAKNYARRLARRISAIRPTHVVNCAQ